MENSIGNFNKTRFIQQDKFSSKSLTYYFLEQKWDGLSNHLLNKRIEIKADFKKFN